MINMNQYPISNLKLSPQTSSTTPKHSPPTPTPPNRSQSPQQCDQILFLKMPQFQHLLTQYNKNFLLSPSSPIPFQTLLNQLKKNSQNLQLKQIDYHLTKQFANLNRIKQENQGILKNRIKYLQGKIGMIVGKDGKDGGHFGGIVGVEGGLEKGKQEVLGMDRDREITEIGKKVGELENVVGVLRGKERQLEEEKKKLLQIIKNQQILIKTKDQNSQKVNKIIKKDQHSQTQRQSHKLLNFKFQAVDYLFTGLQSGKHIEQSGEKEGREGEEDEDEEGYIWKLRKLECDFRAVQASNSALRRQLVDLHTFMQQQDQKYQKTIQKLQTKIQKLTEFTPKPLPSLTPLTSRNYSKSTLHPPLTPRSRISDLRSSFYSRKQQRQSPTNKNTIQFANFNIKFELQKNHVDESQDTKLTITSSHLQ